MFCVGKKYIQSSAEKFSTRMNEKKIYFDAWSFGQIMRSGTDQDLFTTSSFMALRCKTRKATGMHLLENTLDFLSV